MHCWSNSWSCCRVTNCKGRKLCFNNPWKSINLVRIWLYYWCEKKCEVQSLFWERTLEISFSYWQIKQSYKRNRKWNLLNVDKRQTLRYDHLWNWKDCVIKVGFSFLFNSVHLWTVPLSFTLFMADYTYQASGPSWSHLGNNKIKLLEHQRLLSKQAGYVQWDQLSVVIEDSRWQLLYLVVTQFPRKWYSLISVKNCCYCRFF